MLAGGTSAQTPGETPEILPAPPAQIFMPPANLPPSKVHVMDDNVKPQIGKRGRKTVWTQYEIATGISKQEPLVRVSTLLSVIGKDATKAFDAFEWGEAKDKTKMEHLLAKFDAYCEPRTQVIYEGYQFDLIKAAKQMEHQVKQMGASANTNALKQGRSKCNRPSMPLRAANSKHQKQTYVVIAADVELHTQSKNVWHLVRNVTDVAINMNHYQSLCRSKTVSTVQLDDGPDQYEICTVGKQPS